MTIIVLSRNETMGHLQDSISATGKYNFAADAILDQASKEGDNEQHVSKSTDLIHAVYFVFNNSNNLPQ